MIKRTLFNTVIEKFNNGKAIVLLGPRQVGKFKAAVVEKSAIISTLEIEN
jgi:predicted AAA+ superfamily ATPase